MKVQFTRKINGRLFYYYWRQMLAVLILLIAIFFFRAERHELRQLVPELKHASFNWVLAGIGITIFYVLAQALMYVTSFKALGIRYRLIDAVELFLKRNFLSVFLPAGGVSSLAYIPSHIRRQQILPTQLHQASGLYMLSGFLSVIIVGLPIILIGVFTGTSVANAWVALLLLLVLVTAAGWLLWLLKNKKGIYHFLYQKFPSLTNRIDELLAANISFKRFWWVVACSIMVETCGILHVAIALKALGLHFSWNTAGLAYIVSVLLMIISPFLKGLGAVEFSIAFILGRAGTSAGDALSATILYRIFEFWLPLAGGLVAFAWKGRNLFVRIFPALLIFVLGLINIISVITPPIASRINILHQYIPFALVHASKLLVFLMGLMLIASSALLLKGLRTAWWFAFTLSAVSLVGHLGKALDWEEAIFAFFTLVILTAGYKQYRVKNNAKLFKTGLALATLIFVVVTLFGYTAFYFIDVKHFGVDFTWLQSLQHTFNIFLLVNDSGLQPKTRFAHEFIWLIRSLGFFSWSYLFYTLLRPFISVPQAGDGRTRALQLVDQYGISSVDYFKAAPDKLLFFSKETDGMVAYRTANGYAIVLEEPVCDEEDKLLVLTEFDLYCRKTGLIPAFYRVDENSLTNFNLLRKRVLLIGQEAIIDLDTFKLEGRDKKSLRNGLNSLEKKGFKTAVHLPPHQPDFLETIRMVSNEWLDAFDKKELIFSQGMFDENELSLQTIITVSDENGLVKAFLNVIPDYAPDECTYDLIRKTPDAPGGCMDLLIISLIDYARSKNTKYLNLGLVPMAGIEEPDSTAERIIRYAYDNVKRFSHYKGLRNFKEKYASIWQNKYLVYENQYDLLQLPLALNNVMKPLKN